MARAKKDTTIDREQKYTAQEVMDQINRHVKSNQLSMASGKQFEVKYLPTGVIPIDDMLGGGLACGRFTEIYGEFSCLVPETLVLTSDLHWVQLGTVKSGDELVGFDEFPEPGQGRQRRLRRTVVISNDRIQKQCYEIQTDQGTTTIASNEHPWLVNYPSGKNKGNKWVATQDLIAGDTILWLEKPWGEPEYKEEAAYLAGLLDGEGWISENRVCFGQVAGAVLEQGERYLNLLGFETTRGLQNKAKPEHKQCYRVAVCSGVSKMMQLLGQVKTVRLRENFKKTWEGAAIGSKGPTKKSITKAKITSIKFVGEREVCATGTTTHTFFADGMATHNTLKSYIGLCAIASAQKRGGVAALIDTERSFDPSWAESLGVNLDELILWPNPEESFEVTAESALDKAELFIRYGIDLLIFDSVAAMIPKVDNEKNLADDKAGVANLARLMSRAMAKLTSVNKHTAVLFVNQLRVTGIGSFFGTSLTTTGGKALSFYASVRIKIRKAEKIFEKHKVWTGTEMSDSNQQVAQLYQAVAEKSKLNKPFRECWFMFDYRTGQIDSTGYLIGQGLERNLIRRPNNVMWEYDTLKVKGKDAFRAEMEATGLIGQLEMDIADGKTSDPLEHAESSEAGIDNGRETSEEDGGETPSL